MVLWNFDFLWKNYRTMAKNYGTLEKKLWFYVKKKTTKLWYYIENYGTLIYEEKKYGTKNLRNLDL